MKTSFVLSSLVVFLAVSGTAQDYAIKMQPPFSVGQRYQLTVMASNSSTMTMTTGQRVLGNQKEDLRVELESVATVLAIDAKGRPTKESHRIVKLLQNAAREPVLAAGTTVVISRSGEKEVVEIDGKPITNAMAKALALAVEITSGGPTDDEIFGTTERKQVGERWLVNETLALRDANAKMAGSGMKVSNLKGMTTLQKVTKDAGTDVLHLVSNLGATLSTTGTTPLKSLGSTMTATFTAALPIDNTKSIREEGGTMAMTMKASGKPNPEGPEVLMSASMKLSIIRRYKLLD